MARPRTDAAAPAPADVDIDRPDETVPVITEDASAKEIKERLTFQADKDLHPSKAPSAPDDQPGGPAATEPNRPPVVTNRSDEAIITALATGAGQHTPPDPDTVDGDGYVRPVKAEANS